MTRHNPDTRWRINTVLQAVCDLQLLAVLPLDVELPGLLDGLTPLVEAWRAKPPLRDLLP